MFLELLYRSFPSTLVAERARLFPTDFLRLWLVQDLLLSFLEGIDACLLDSLSLRGSAHDFSAEG
jgi:hypothetical protein